MSEWIEVEADKLMTPHTETIRGVELQVFVSPHDTPRKVRGQYDQSLKRFVIELKYLDDDKWETLQRSEDHILTIYSGSRSGRIGRIEIDVHGAGVKQVSLTVEALRAAEEELKTMTGQQKSLAARLNFRAALEAIASSETQLSTA